MALRCVNRNAKIVGITLSIEEETREYGYADIILCEDTFHKIKFAFCT